LQVPISKVDKPKTHDVDPDSLKLDNRDPANIPSLKKLPKERKAKKYRVKKMPDVMPALEQLFEKEPGTDLPIPPPPQEKSETEELMKQVMEQLSAPKKLSEMI
jgi:hypothetical protein